MTDILSTVKIVAVSDIAAIIRDARQRRGLTQLELAQAVGVTRQSIVNLETGRANPSLASVLAAVHALGLRLDVSGVQATHHDVDVDVTDAANVTHAPVDLDAVLDAVRFNHHAVDTDG